jgi:predicted amidophosphoribosyltransferase
MFSVDPRLVYRNGLVGFATMPYNDSSQKMIRAFKELGESGLGSLMAEWMLPLLSCFTEPPTRLVPIPSNKISLRERGFNPAEVLARELCSANQSLRYENLLIRSRATLDQSKLNPDQRQENQSGSMLCQAGNERVIIVDDVVTTGATVLAASKTLEKAGHRVLGFLAFAETEANGCNLSTQAKKPEDGGTSWN